METKKKYTAILYGGCESMDENSRVHHRIARIEAVDPVNAGRQAFGTLRGRKANDYTRALVFATINENGNNVNTIYGVATRDKPIDYFPPSVRWRYGFRPVTDAEKARWQSKRSRFIDVVDPR